MMFSKALIFSNLAMFAAAAPNPWTTVTVTASSPTATTISQCNIGNAQCCNTVGPAKNDAGINALLGLLGIVLQDLSVVVGTGCTPITVIGVSNNGCDQKAVCCTDNHFNGLINIGCSPISL